MEILKYDIIYGFSLEQPQCVGIVGIVGIGFLTNSRNTDIELDAKCN